MDEDFFPSFRRQLLSLSQEMGIKLEQSLVGHSYHLCSILI
uniref:Uncharacterized protein n=1 Tax=Trichinella nativa TaxID=6335 RepID=A0A0V1KHR4_9BILA